MPRFVNIAPPGKPQYVIDADDVALITAAGENKGLLLHSRTGGAKYLAHFVGVVNVRDVVDALRCAGIRLIAVSEDYKNPKGHADRAVVLFNPDAMASFTVSDILDRDSKAPRRMAIIKLEGAETEILNISPERAADIRAELLEKTRLPLLEFSANEGHVRFTTSPGYTIVNPTKIGRILATMQDVKVKFTGCPFDMSFTKPLPPGKFLPDLATDHILQEKHAGGLKAIALKLAAGQKNLAQIMGSQRHLLAYVRPSDVQKAQVDAQNNCRLTLEFRDAAGSDSLTFDFTGEKYVDRALSALNLRPV